MPRPAAPALPVAEQAGFERRRLIAYSHMALDVKRQVDIAVSCIRLGKLWRHSCLCQIRDQRVAIGVEVDEQSILVTIGNADSFEIELHHFGCSSQPAGCRLEGEKWTIYVKPWLVGQPMLHAIGHGWVQRNDVVSPPFAIAGFYAHASWLRLEFERSKRKRGKLFSPVSGPSGKNTKHRSITAGKPLNRMPCLSRFYELGEFAREQGAPLSPNIGFSVKRMKMYQRARRNRTVPDHPLAELLHRIQVVVAGFDSKTVRATFLR